VEKPAMLVTCAAHIQAMTRQDFTCV